jgi:hypothetical protein
MTGQDVGNLLTTKLGEFGSGYFDNARLNDFFFNSLTDIIDRKIQQFQRDGKVTREMRPLITTLTGIVPTNGLVDLSQSSTEVPNYYAVISVNVTSPYRTTTLSKQAMERRYDTLIDIYSEGDARYPRYLMAADVMRIEPSDATLVDIDYFIKAIQIDVSDNVAQVPYNDKLIQLVIDNAINVIGFEERDDFNIAASNQMQQQNP